MLLLGVGRLVLGELSKVLLVYFAKIDERAVYCVLLL